MVSIADCIDNDDDCNNDDYKERYYDRIFNILAEKIGSNIICCIAFNSSKKHKNKTYTSGDCSKFRDDCSNESADIYLIIEHNKIDIIVIECHPLDPKKIQNRINKELLKFKVKRKGAGSESTVENLYNIIKKIKKIDEKIKKYYVVIEKLRGKYKSRVLPIFLTNSNPLKNIYVKYIEAIL